MDKERFRSGFNKSRNFLLIGGSVAFLLVVAIIYLVTGRYVTTDDSYIQAARTEISSNVSGRVVAVYVKDNQAVHKDDLLFKIDDRDFQNAVKNAQAKLANAKLQIESLKATYKQRQADRRASQAVLTYMQKEFKRQEILAKQGISSIAQLDQARESYLTAQQNVNSEAHDLNAIQASLDNDPDINVIDHPIVQQAQAELDQALLNLSYTSVLAPANGIVSKVELLQVGDYLRAADAAFALISTTDIWVEANFKETELTHIRPGQSVSFTVDTYPDRKYRGKVASISPGTGASFSLIPPENATGNWVKVVQRLPVRISVERIDPKDRLRMGMSVEVEVDTQQTRLSRGL